MARRRKLFRDWEPVPVDGRDSADRDESPPEDQGNVTSITDRVKSRGRKTTGTTPEASDQEMLEVVVCFKPLWEMAFEIEEAMSGQPGRSRVGRPREYHAFCGLLVECAGYLFGTYQRVYRNINKPHAWKQLQDVVRAAYPDDERIRLPDKPISRSQACRFRSKHLTAEMLQSLRDLADETSVAGAQWMGMLQPGLGSLSNPDARSYVAADATWMPALYKATRDTAVDHKTGEIVRRFDPDAVPYHTNDGKKAKSPGHLLVMGQTRNPNPQERVILFSRFKSPKDGPKSDATIAVDALLDLRSEFPHLRGGSTGLIYDMALSTPDIDRLLEDGLIPVSKVRRLEDDESAKFNLGVHTFTAVDGTKSVRPVTAIDGTPCIVVTDGDGKDFHQPLKLMQVKKEERIGEPAITTRWVVPDKPLVPKHLVGALTRVTHLRTKEERNAGTSRSRALRVFPESEPRFDEIFGLREDTESNNSHLKSLLQNKRCRTGNRRGVELNTIGYQMFVLVRACMAHHHRTGLDMTPWFGQHRLPSGEEPVPKAA